MTRYFRLSLLGAAVAVAIVGAGALGYWYGHRDAAAPGASGSAGADPQAAPGPVAAVGTVPIRRGTIDDRITAYGTVVFQPGESAAITVPFESRVTRTWVTVGQPVAAGAALVDVEPSPATRLALLEAENAVAVAERDLAQVRQRFEQRLATNQELSAVEAALQSARARLDNLRATGATGPQRLKSDAPGVVAKVNVQVGQIVPAGTPLAEAAAENSIEVRLGVESGDAPRVRPGQTAALSPVNRAATRPVDGRVRLVAQRVNPATRLVDVFVTPPAGARLLVDAFVRGEMTVRTARGLVVPRPAVVPEDSGYVLFTVENGRAARHAVRVVLETDRDVLIEGDPALREGQPAVVVGNHELTDGMAVTVEPPAPATAPVPTTRPTEVPPS